MADVFVSYVSEDRGIAEKISHGLEGAGLSVWWDRHIPGGMDFTKEIDRQLDAAKVVIVLWSRTSVDSDWVRDEAQQARDQKKLIPLCLDSVQPPLGFRQAQSLDFGGWNGELTAASFIKLVDSARHFLGDASPAAQAPAPTYDETVARRANANSVKSVAVLPFTDMSEKKDQEYFADGMAEEIINLLAKVPDLLVPARTSSFYFKGKQTKIPEIARELGVANVLEGSVRRSGDHLRVTAQLVRADNGYHLWSETYDRELRDVFKVQDDIANAVVQALQIKLMGGELNSRRGGTQNLEAYQFYLRGLNAQYQNTQASLDAADDHLKQAIRLDPNFGLAWAQRAAGVVVMTEDGFLSPTEGYEHARQLAQTALQLSPDLADAHAWLQYVHRTLDWDWTAAEAEGRRAIALDATNTWAMNVGGLLSITLGRWDDAERKFRSGLVRDPLNIYLIFNIGVTYYGAGRFGEAEAIFRKVLQMEPDFLWTRAYLAKTLLVTGDPEGAFATIQQDRSYYRFVYLPAILEAAGRPVDADRALQAQISSAKSANSGVWGVSYFVALNYAHRGDHDRAIEWLERAYEEKAVALVEILSEHLFKDLVHDVRFNAFLRKMNLPE